MTDQSAVGGRPQYVPTDDDREKVRIMVSCGISHLNIAKVMRVSEPTLRKHYSHELETGAIEANVKMGKSLFDKGMGPGKEGVTAAIFWMKARAGWRDSDAEGGKKANQEAVARAAREESDWSSLLN